MLILIGAIAMEWPTSAAHLRRQIPQNLHENPKEIQNNNNNNKFTKNDAPGTPERRRRSVERTGTPARKSVSSVSEF